jgi:hypothetical protein
VTKAGDDRELSRLFDELRRSDEASAPAFRSVLSRPRTRPRRPWLSLLRVATAVVLLGLIGVVVRLARRPTPETRLEATARTLTRWKAPTDSLLRTPGSELLTSIPRLVTKILDYSSLQWSGRGRIETPKVSR